MNSAELEYQANKLAAYIARGGSENDWWASRDFSGTERAAIKAQLTQAHVRHRGMERIAAFAKNRKRRKP